MDKRSDQPNTRLIPDQVVGFHFMVIFEGLSDTSDSGDSKSVDVRFQSVSGLEVQFETDTWKEGGENRFAHELPGRSKFTSSLTLKRGVIGPGASSVTNWCNKAFINLQVEPLNVVNVWLLDDNHQILLQWSLNHVWPKSWKIAELNAERSEVLIETLELNYNRFTYEKKQ